MPVICWAPLAKSAQDATTIAEYITGKVLEHNVNPSAHGLDGYSVYNHRAADVLDHPDYSVKSDKVTTDWIISKKFETAPGVGPGTDGVLFDPNGIMMYQTAKRLVNIPKSGDAEFLGNVLVNKLFYNKDVHIVDFASLDAFDVDQAEDVFNFLGAVSVSTTAVLNNENYIQAEAQTFNRIRFDKNPTFRVRFKVLNNSYQGVRVVMGSFGHGMTTQVLGIWTTGTQVWLYVNKVGEGAFIYEITNVDPMDWHTYEVVLTSGSNAKVWVDGVYRFSIWSHIPIDSGFSGILSISAWCRTGGTISKVFLETYTFAQDL